MTIQLDLAVRGSPSYPINMNTNVYVTLGISTPLTCKFFLSLILLYYLCLFLPLLLSSQFTSFLLSQDCSSEENLVRQLCWFHMVAFTHFADSYVAFTS